MKRHQWHPLFAKLLRPILEGYYEIQTNVAVGDVPREADVVVARRTGSDPLPFRGIWKYLTPLNVLEFKGPSVSPRFADLDLIVELGLGIHRRVNQERRKERKRPLAREEVALWYLANRLGKRFLDGAASILGPVEQVGRGIWRCRVLRRLLFLVSGRDLPVEQDSLPLMILGKEPSETEKQVARFVQAEPKLWRHYGDVLVSLHPEFLGEVIEMARFGGFEWSLEPLFKLYGTDRVLNEAFTKASPKKVIRHIERFLANLPAAQRKALKKRLSRPEEE